MSGMEPFWYICDAEDGSRVAGRFATYYEAKGVQRRFHSPSGAFGPFKVARGSKRFSPTCGEHGSSAYVKIKECCAPWSGFAVTLGTLNAIVLRLEEPTMSHPLAFLNCNAISDPKVGP